MEDYCTAIELAKLPSKLGPRGTRYYDEERFREFVKQDIDIRDLGQHMADFSQGGGVAQALHTIRTGLQSGLQGPLGCRGHLFQIGSFYDGSKTGSLNEVDCLYVVNEEDVVVQQAGRDQGHFSVYLKGQEIRPREINKKLIAAMADILSVMTLPDGWRHSGYRSQEFSGVRCNGPAVTAMFSNKDEDQISLDISVAVPLTDQIQAAKDFPEHLRNHCQSVTDTVIDIQGEVPRTAIAPVDLHLIGNLVSNTWQPTTALAEAEILRILHTECSVKGTVDICKAISSKQQKWYENNNTQHERPADEESNPILASVQEGIACKQTLSIYSEADQESKAQLKDKLNTEMAYNHIWLTANDRQAYKEVLKADASINTAAMKHIVLRTALRMKGAFSEHNKTYRDCLVRTVFEELSDPGSVYTPHAFLHGVELAKFSLSVTLSDIKDDVVRDLQEQCRFILDEGLKKRKRQLESLPKMQKDSEFGEYYYKICLGATEKGCCSVSDAEQIALTMSAMMNTSGGVLEVQINESGNVGHSSYEFRLNEFNSQLIRIITTQENWIPTHLFSSYVKPCVNEQINNIYFFVNKTKDLVTHCSYAYTHVSGEVKLIADYDIICRLLRECSCKGDDRCLRHKDVQPESELESALSEADELKAGTWFSELPSKQYFCRHYALHGRHVTHVLCTQSVRNDIKQLVSALANTDGGSIILGVTHTGTPVVRGHTLDSISTHQLNECLLQIINGQTGTDITVWSTATNARENWKLFVHPVSGRDVDRHVIEISVRKCPGGMFCAMPLCFEINNPGDILPLNQFEQWKEKMLLSHKPVTNEIAGRLDDHFGEDVLKEADLPSDPLTDDQARSTLHTTDVQNVQKKHPQTSQVFHWWVANNEEIASESLRFDHCCAQELADEAIDIHKPFLFYPSVQTATEHCGNIPYLESSLIEIEQKYRDENGAGVIIQNIPDHLGAELKDMLPAHHLCDVIVLKANCSPVIISVLGNDCDKAEAENYSKTLVRLLKRFCLLTYGHLCLSSTHLCFQRHLYYLGSMQGCVDGKVHYPADYLRPTNETLDIVRYTLAAILLHCEPMTDRFGDIMVRHLSSIQATLLWEKRSKVTIIEGKAGSGKSVLALEIMRRITNHRQDRPKILYLCRGKGLAAFVKYETEMMGISVDIQTVQPEGIEEMTEKSFNQYTEFIIDDAHALPVTVHAICRMYDSVFSSLSTPNSHVCIFLDPDMQDYRGCIPTDYSKAIQNMVRKYRFIRRQDVKTESLGKVLRNSSRICQFIGANLESEMEELRNIRNLPEDGAYLYTIEDLSKTKDTVFRRRDEESEEKAEEDEDESENNNNEDVDAGAAEYTHTQETLVSRLRDILKGTMYKERHITILTDNTSQKTQIQEILRCTKYQTQSSTSFPVKGIVVDTLENFEGLESPVILFIVPESWGTGHVGSLKYRLCIATRAISRLEFLVPWDPKGREQDLVELRRAFQMEPPVDYGILSVTRVHRIQAGAGLYGLCYFSGTLYTVERRETRSDRDRIAVYSVTKEDIITLLDTLDIEGGGFWQPRVDPQSGLVYISCASHGLRVVRFDGSNLVPVTTLRCIGRPGSLAVISSHTLCVCDWDKGSVHQVDVTQDRVTARLQPLFEVSHKRPDGIAVLGDTLLVGYMGDNLVIYRHGVPTPGTILPQPRELQDVYSLTTDHHSSFLLTDGSSSTVYVLDVSGNLTHTIPIPGYREPRDCTVVEGQLWVGCYNGDIVVLSPQ